MTTAAYTDANPVSVVPLLDALTDYQKKGVGVDMVLKSVLNIARLCTLFSRNPADKHKLCKLADTIIECRMLCNFGRPSITLRQGLMVLRKKDCMTFWHWVFTALSIFLRAPEQLSGDLNYLQKTVMHQWSRDRLSFFYRFFKSWSLTCCLLSEFSRRAALKSAVLDAVTPAEHAHASLEMKVSNLLIVRTLCDMYVYFKWIPSYEPVKVLEYGAGLVSGLVGVWLVWKDARYVMPPRSPMGDSDRDCCEKDALKRAVCVLDSEGAGSEGGASADDGS